MISMLILDNFTITSTMGLGSNKLDTVCSQRDLH